MPFNSIYVCMQHESTPGPDSTFIWYTYGADEETEILFRIVKRDRYLYTFSLDINQEGL